MNAAAYPTATLRNVEVFSVGSHRGSPYTPADLRDMVANFVRATGTIDPPVVVGHEEVQPLTEGLAGNTGTPAVGWVQGLRAVRRKGKDGTPRLVLLADLVNVHPTVAGAINRRAYRKVSAEVYDEPPDGAPANCRGKMLRRVALLGGELPEIKTLADLPYAEFSEAGGRLATLRMMGRSLSRDGQSWVCYAEVQPMERATLEEQLKALGWTDAQIATLAKVDDDTFAALANATLAQAAGVGDAGAAPVEGEPPVEEPPLDEPLPDEGGEPPPDRATMESDLAAAGEDPEALAAMGDDELAALWQEKVGGGVPAMSETKKKGAPAAVPTAAQFAEARRTLAAIRREAATTFSEVRRRREAERRAAVGALCKRWSEQRYVLPAEVDPGSTRPNVYHRLMHASLTRVVKFGETAQSEYDAFVSEIEARGPGYAGRHFGERIKEAHGKGAQHADVDKEVDDYVSRRYGKSRARAGA